MWSRTPRSEEAFLTISKTVCDFGTAMTTTRPLSLQRCLRGDVCSELPKPFPGTAAGLARGDAERGRDATKLPAPRSTGSWECRSGLAQSRGETNSWHSRRPCLWHPHACVPPCLPRGQRVRSRGHAWAPRPLCPAPSAAAALTWSRWWALPWASGRGTGWWRFCSRSKPLCKAGGRSIKKKKPKGQEKRKRRW